MALQLNAAKGTIQWYLVLPGCGLTRLDAAKVLPLVILVCQRGCKLSANPLQPGEETEYFQVSQNNVA